MKPKEGTILTVAKGMADKAVEAAEETDDVLGVSAAKSLSTVIMY